MILVYLIGGLSILFNIMTLGAANEMLSHAKHLYQQSYEIKKEYEKNLNNTFPQW